MNPTTQLPPNAVVSHQDHIRTNSLKVAEAFGKQHKNVIRKLESLECSSEFNQLNFELVEYIDQKGEMRPMWEMTKDGFLFLVMGFTGHKAAQVKEAYITAFNSMAEQLTGLNQAQQLGELQQALHCAHSELLKARPRWQKLARYHALGLSQAELARLVELKPTALRDHLQRMARTGLIAYQPSTHYQALGRLGRQVQLSLLAALEDAA